MSGVAGAWILTAVIAGCPVAAWLAWERRVRRGGRRLASGWEPPADGTPLGVREEASWRIITGRYHLTAARRNDRRGRRTLRETR